MVFPVQNSTSGTVDQVESIDKVENIDKVEMIPVGEALALEDSPHGEEVEAHTESDTQETHYDNHGNPFVIRHEGMNRQMRRAKNGIQQYAQLKQNQMAREMKALDKDGMKYQGERLTWGQLKDLHDQCKASFAPILALIRQVRDPELKPYIDPADAQALNDALAILNKDVPISLEELKGIGQQHLHHAPDEPVKMEDIEHYLLYSELYGNFYNGYQGTIVPMFELVADVIRKADLRRTIAQNPEAVAKVLEQKAQAAEATQPTPEEVTQ